MLHQTLIAFDEFRLSSGPLPPGIAPYTSSNSFKIRRTGLGATAKRWDHRLSLESRSRCRSTLKSSASIPNSSTMLNIGVARPSPQYFPWQSMMFRGDSFDDSEERVVAYQASSMSCARGETGYDLDVALNYGYSAGSPQLLRFITEHVELIHNPPYDDWETCLTCGTTSAIEIVLRMLCNRGDWVLVEAYTYTGLIETARPLGLNMLGVQMDQIGLLPDDLDSKLRSWDTARGPKPFVLYMIPTGHNPTGTTQTVERRRAIYRVAEIHDLCIIEDDPYYFLQLGSHLCASDISRSTSITPDYYLNKLPASYLSIDLSGRVIRLDTSSKILAPGLRCGWMTGCSQLVTKFLNHTEFSTVSPSGPSQVMLYKLLDETWGHEGFVSWLVHLSLQSQRRLKTMTDACVRYLPSHICRWTNPTMGMFLWIWIDFDKMQAFRTDGFVEEEPESARDIAERIYGKAIASGVQISKGSWFAVEDVLGDQFFRLTFAAASEDTLDVAIERFGNVLRTELMLDDVDRQGDRVNT